METVFREALPADAPAMADLVASAWQAAYRGILSDTLLNSIDAQARAERVRRTIQTNPDFWFYILEADGEIAGVAGLCAMPDGDLPDTSEIKIFYIRPDLQKQGLGRAMMRGALDALHSKGFQRIALWVLKENHAARAFYEKLGFVPDGAEKTLEHLENATEVRYQYHNG